MFRITHRLSIMIAVLAAIASIGGLFFDLYRDNDWVRPQLLGNDMVTLIVAVPMLLLGLYFWQQGSQRARLVWLSMLVYMLYNYAFYLFGAAFNEFFLVYVALFSLSMYTLIFEATGFEASWISQCFDAQTPVRWVSGLMGIIALMLGLMWIGLSLGFVASGKVPQVVVDSGHPTGIIFALDLSFIVPAMVIGAVLLWQRHPWGYVLGTIMTIKGATYTLALLAMGVFSAQETGKWDALMGLWLVLCAGCVLASVQMLRHMHTEHPLQPASSQQQWMVNMTS